MAAPTSAPSARPRAKVVARWSSSFDPPATARIRASIGAWMRSSFTAGRSTRRSSRVDGSWSDLRAARRAEDRDDRHHADPDPGEQRGRHEPEVADPEEVEAETRAELVASPRAEEGRDHEQWELAARGAADQDVERGVEDADEQGKDGRRSDHRPRIARQTSKG